MNTKLARKLILMLMQSERQAEAQALYYKSQDERGRQRQAFQRANRARALSLQVIERMEDNHVRR